MLYFWVKLIHIISSTLLFGTGLGSAFYMYFTYRTRQIPAIAVVARYVVLADWWFTTPAIILQPLTGFIMIYLAHYSLSSWWIMGSLFLYILTGICWLPVVWLQIKMQEMAGQANKTSTTLPARYHRYMNLWFWLGWPAFISVSAIFYLMVLKP